MSGRLLDDGFRLLGLVMIGVIVCFLLTPIVVTAVMAFDARAYLGPLPPPALSLRWFAQFFSDDYFLRGLSTSVQLAVALRHDIALRRGDHGLRRRARELSPARKR